jgi:hypothetical protein
MTAPTLYLIVIVGSRGRLGSARARSGARPRAHWNSTPSNLKIPLKNTKKEKKKKKKTSATKRKKKKTPLLGIEPKTTRLKAVRSTR